ncbi:isoleucine--tRNA ligase [Candidatus Saccharibacteria bacterium]|nr:isoleucine--tRNA ligase [Candidatus Saccharibacteria bacterium]
MKKIAPYSAKQVEEKILSYWQDNGIFERSLEQTKNGKPFSFYDGPPFANGLPHFGHSLVTSIKDSIGRFQTMRGRSVERQNGWDCHGLPVEFEVEKKLGISGKKQITELGIDVFNAACRDSVFTYKKDWEDFFDRIGRWTDKKNAYATIDTNYTESVWWVFSQIYNKGLIYKGYKSMPYCPRCTTPLSNFEVNEGYKDNVTDPSVYVKFKLSQSDEYLLAWTTTPWSLPGNTALAVKPDAQYVRVELKDDSGNSEIFILAEKRLENLNAETFEVLERILGKDLVGLEYEPLFAINNLEQNDNLYKIWPAEFVSIDDGTGVLHVAPAFGEDDLALAQEHSIPVLHTVDTAGKIKIDLGLEGFEGKFFKGADKLIIEQLTKEGVIYSAETFEHTYPFCYRCDTPLLYYAIDTWFVAVSTIKNQLQDSAKDITWSPDHINTGRFGKWLEGARDWAISRNRYWGAPVPIWVNDEDDTDIIVIESVERLRELAEGTPDLSDLHRPFIDNVVIKKDGKTYHRIEEVIDCWFESGSMPYAQKHFPFENEKQFADSFPADYIGEGLDQTRLWFYVLHVIATILFEKPAYKQVLVNGMIMAADGRKLSKSLKNYPPLDDVFANEGADSLRFYLLSSTPAVSADYMRFDRDALKDINRNVFMTLGNSVSFLSMYAEIDNWKPTSLERPEGLKNPLDTWLSERVALTVKTTTEALDKFELAKASWPVYELIEELSNWYIRRSRRRFWKSEDDSDKLDAYKTLHWSLITICQLLAPFAPFASDYFYQHLTEDIVKAPDSVHLSLWPEVLPSNQVILDSMQIVRQLVNDGLAARAQAGIKVRQPLAKATIGSTIELSRDLQLIISEELNTKKIVVKKADTASVVLDTKITQELKNEGVARDIVRNIQQARKDAGLDVENYINLVLMTDSIDIQNAIKQCKKIIQNEVLATTLKINFEQFDYTKSTSIENSELTISLQKASGAE